MKFTDIPYNILKKFFLTSQGQTKQIDVIPSVITYTITSSMSGSGVVQSYPSDTTDIPEGLSCLFTFTPNTGKILQSVWLDNVNIGTPVSYLFTNIKDTHTINIYFST